MDKILGVDPGSVCTGYGVIGGEGDDLRYICSGSIVLGKRSDRFEKLRVIFQEIHRIIERFSPCQFAIENVFYHKNAKSSLVLGEARGAAILAAVLSGLPVSEYSAREVKQSITGNGAAHKSQVCYMLGKILRLDPPPKSADESDALAIALCHAFRNNERVF